MAFTRKALKDMGLTDELIDKVATLHSTSMSDYVPKSQLEEELKKQLGDTDIDTLRTQAAKATDLEKQLGGIKFDYALAGHLKAKGVKGDNAAKAVRALLDPEKIKLDGDKLTGIDEQLDELIKDESVKTLFTTAEDSASPTKPQFGAPPKGGMPGGKDTPSFNDVWGFVPPKK